jgi:hypothetical protein
VSSNRKPALSQWHAYCEYCEEIRVHRGDYELVVNSDNGVWIHTLLLCAICDGPIFVVQEPLPEGDVSEPAQLYPAVRGGAIHGTPKAVRQSFVEAVRCFEQAAGHTATAIMCRRTLEVVSKEHGATGRDLKTKMKALKDNGVIDQTLLDWATELRALGNEAAHGDGEISRQDAKDALEFTEAMLSYIYTYRQSFDFFKRRRDANKKRPKKSAAKKQ